MIGTREEQPADSPLTRVIVGPAAVGPPAYTAHLLRQPEAAGQARRLVRCALDTWRMPELADTAALLASELTTLLLRHAPGQERFRFTVSRRSGTEVRIDVVDEHPAAAGVPSVDDCTRLLLDAVAGQWGTGPAPSGRRMWASTGR